VGQLSIPYLVYSTGILLREGLETILVIVALAAGARQAQEAMRETQAKLALLEQKLADDASVKSYQRSAFSY